MGRLLWTEREVLGTRFEKTKCGQDFFFLHLRQHRSACGFHNTGGKRGVGCFGVETLCVQLFVYFAECSSRLCRCEVIFALFFNSNAFHSEFKNIDTKRVPAVITLQFEAVEEWLAARKLGKYTPCAPLHRCRIMLQAWSKVVGTMLTEYEITSYCFTSRLPLTLWVVMPPFPQNQCWCELVVVTYCVQLIFQHGFGGGGKLISSQHFWPWL